MQKQASLRRTARMGSINSLLRASYITHIATHRSAHIEHLKDKYSLCFGQIQTLSPRSTASETVVADLDPRRIRNAMLLHCAAYAFVDRRHQSKSIEASTQQRVSGTTGAATIS
jgi:hypothetical protein